MTLQVICLLTTFFYQEGFLTCSYFTNAVTIGDHLTAKHPNVKVDVSAYVKQQWSERARELQEVHINNSNFLHINIYSINSQQEFKTNQKSSPFIYEGCDSNNLKHVGGYTDFAQKVKATYKMNVPMD